MGQLTRYGLARGAYKIAGFLTTESPARLSLFDYHNDQTYLASCCAMRFSSRAKLVAEIRSNTKKSLVGEL
jgi:hypothetical protein